MAVVVLVALAAFYSFYLDPVYNKINKGLDIQGGVSVVYQAVPTEENPITPESMVKASQIIERRVNGLGVAEAVVQLEGEDRIIVQLPGVENPDQALEAIGRTALLEFVGPDDKVYVTGADLRTADAAIINTGEAVVTLQFNEEGSRKFEEATRQFLGQNISIHLDKEEIISPVVEAVITNGQAQIYGRFSYEEALGIAVALQSGALPVQLEIIENRTISATLGNESWQSSMSAAIIGLILVLAFMFLYYRIPGLWADLALMIYMILYLFVLYGMNATLTLPGVAGIVLSIGMAVDANVVIYERIKEEVQRGETLRSAIEQGFKNGFRAVFDGNATTLIAAGILFWLGTGPIRGFALTLAVGVLISMLTAVYVTHYLLRWLTDAGAKSSPLFFAAGRSNS